jgi:hypothetical protein
VLDPAYAHLREHDPLARVSLPHGEQAGCRPPLPRDGGRVTPDNRWER